MINSPHSDLMTAMQNKANTGFKANTKDRASHRSKKCPERCAAPPRRAASAPLQMTTAQWTHPNTHRSHWDHPWFQNGQCLRNWPKSPGVINRLHFLVCGTFQTSSKPCKRHALISFAHPVNLFFNHGRGKM